MTAWLLTPYREQLAKTGDKRSFDITWQNETEKANWQGPNDIKALHATASFLSDNRVVFNIKGNSYRLVVHVNYRRSFVTILQLGTHAEYDKWKP